MFIEDGPRQTKIQIAGILKQFLKCETLLSGPLWCSKTNSG